VFLIEKLGHQEIFMGAIDLLRDFVRKKHVIIKNYYIEVIIVIVIMNKHYNLDRENLQYLAMQLGCKARSL